MKFRTNRMTDSILNSTTRLQQAKEKIEKLNSLLYAIRNIYQVITREKNRNRLLQGACDSLIDARGLYSAWISLLDESGASVTFVEAGCGEDFLLINEMLHQGELPACGQMALKQPDVVVTEDPVSTCTNCPLKERCGDRWSMAVRLEHGGNVYGLLTMTVPKDLIIEKQELTLFKEIAGDIAIALHTIKLEEKHKQADAALLESEAKFRTLVEKIPTITYTAALAATAGCRPRFDGALAVHVPKVIIPNQKKQKNNNFLPSFFCRILYYYLIKYGKERGRNNLLNYASQLQATFARSQITKISK